jgi:hypothetical protein
MSFSLKIVVDIGVKLWYNGVKIREVIKMLSLTVEEGIEYSRCLKWFINRKIFNKRPDCYDLYEDLLAMPVIEVRYLLIKYQIISPKDRSVNHKVLCQILASFLYSCKFEIWRVTYCGKQIPV